MAWRGQVAWVDCISKEHADLWSFTISEEEVGTELSIEFDTVAVDTTFDLAAEVYVIDAEDTCTSWEGDDEFRCTVPPREYDCPAITLTPTEAGTYYLAVSSLGTCASETGEYSILPSTELSFTLEEDDTVEFSTPSPCSWEGGEPAVCDFESGTYTITTTASF